MSLLFRLAWRNVWRHKRRSLITAVAMAVGLALCMGYLAFTDGMFALMYNRLVERQLGHVQIHRPNFPKNRALYEVIPDSDQLEQKIRANASVQTSVGRVFGYGLVGVGEQSVGAQITGIHPKDENDFRQLSQQVIEGKYLSETPKKETLLGYRLADELQAKVGDEVVIITQAADGSMGNDLFSIVGLIRTNSTIVDKTNILMHRQDAQELLVIEDSVHEIAILATHHDRIDFILAEIKSLQETEKLLVRPWKEVNPALFQILELQDAMIGLMAFLIFALAGLGILNTMLMSVFERTKELGIMIALGLRPRQIVYLILMETVVLAVLSILIGLVLGGALDWWIVTEGIPLGTSLEFMGFQMDPTLKGEVRPSGIILTAIMVFVISLISSLWPALRAARLQPVVAMREE